MKKQKVPATRNIFSKRRYSNLEKAINQKRRFNIHITILSLSLADPYGSL